MKKSTIKQLAVINLFIRSGNLDSASRSLSSLIRSSRSKKEIDRLKELAIEWDLTNNVNFIV